MAGGFTNCGQGLGGFACGRGTREDRSSIIRQVFLKITVQPLLSNPSLVFQNSRINCFTMQAHSARERGVNVRYLRLYGGVANAKRARGKRVRLAFLALAERRSLLAHLKSSHSPLTLSSHCPYVRLRLANTRTKNAKKRGL